MRIKSILSQSLLTAWLTVCAGLFVVASTSDYLHITPFPDWPAFSNGLMRLHFASGLLHLLGASAGAILFSLACLSLGLWPLRGRLKDRPPELALAAAAFVLGEIVFSMVFLLLLNIGWLTPTTSAVLLLLGFLAGLSTLRAWTSDLPRLTLPAGFRQNERLILTLLGAAVFFGLFYASARLGYDSVAEYFSHAKIMAIARRPVIFYPNDSFVVSSFHPGILFTAAIQLFGDQSARMISWTNGIAILLLGLALGKELGLTPRARLWFLTLMLTSTAFVDLLGDGKIELLSTAPILAAIYWMLRCAERPASDAFILIGILTGFAIISRPYNIFLVPVFVVLFYLNQIRIQIQAGQFRFWQFAHPIILWMLPPLILLGAFHLFENWLFLGSPLAPLTYAQSLGAEDWQWQFAPSNLMRYRLLYPLVVTFLNSPQSLGSVSPLFAAALPFLLVGKIRRGFHPSPPLKQLSVIAIVTLAGWLALFFTVVEIRYVFFLWVILFLLGAEALESIVDNTEGRMRLLAPLSIGLLIFVCVRVAVISVQTFSPIDQNGQAHCYDTGLCTFFESANEQAPLGERVFVLHAYRYYLRPDLFECSSRMEEYASLSDLARENPSEFWAEVYRRGFGFLVYEENFAVRHTRFGSVPDAASAPAWLNVQVVASTPKGTGVVYRLEAQNPPVLPETFCIQNNRGSWEVRSFH